MRVGCGILGVAGAPVREMGWAEVEVVGEVFGFLPGVMEGGDLRRSRIWERAMSIEMRRFLAVCLIGVEICQFDGEIDG